MTVYACPKPVKVKRQIAVVRFIEPSIWDLRRERGPYCEWCNHLYKIGEIAEYERNEAEQRHHCLIGDLKRFHAELSVKENFMQGCGDCHTGACLLDTREVRIWFWSIQCQRYGVDHMQDWLKGLSPKLWISGRIDRAYLGGEISTHVLDTAIDTMRIG